MPDSFPLPDGLPLDDLVRRCEEETRRYQRTRESDGRYCLEIVRRAIRVASARGTESQEPADEKAWTELVRIYTKVIVATINPAAVQSPQDREDLAQEIWLAFWKRASKGDLAFLRLGEFIRYLRRITVHGVVDYQIAETHRRREVHLSVLIAEAGRDNDDDAADRHFGEQLKQILRGEGSDPAIIHIQQRFNEHCERLVTAPTDKRIWIMYRLGYKPKEIAKQLQNEGLHIREKPPTARLVSDVLERIFGRLEEDTEIIDLLQSD